jgi:hypothetical protein
VQVDPIKPQLKLPGTKRLKLKCEEPLSNSVFKFKLRRYTEGPITPCNAEETTELAGEVLNGKTR